MLCLQWFGWQLSLWRYRRVSVCFKYRRFHVQVGGWTSLIAQRYFGVQKCDRPWRPLGCEFNQEMHSFIYIMNLLRYYSSVWPDGKYTINVHPPDWRWLFSFDKHISLEIIPKDVGIRGSHSSAHCRFFILKIMFIFEEKVVLGQY